MNATQRNTTTTTTATHHKQGGRTTHKRLLQASIPALLVTSALGNSNQNVLTNEEQDDASFVYCRTNYDDVHNGTTADHGCPRDKPICVDPLGKPPPPPAAGGRRSNHQHGVKCAPCINYFANPLEADRGCSQDEPLCVVVLDDHDHDNDGGRHRVRRPDWNQAGSKCIPYPCHNTHQLQQQSTTTLKGAVVVVVVVVDEGCTADQPICVDVLGNNPLVGQPGVQCVATAVQQHEDERPAIPFRINQMPFWGRPNKRADHFSLGELSYEEDEQYEELSAWGLVGSSQQVSNQLNAKGLTCSTSSNAGQFSFCGGCPFSVRGGQTTKTCGIAGLSW